MPWSTAIRWRSRGLRRGLTSILVSSVGLLGVGAPLDAQIRRTIERFGVEAYFLDSLQVGVQRAVSRGGLQAQIATDSILPQGVLIAVRVADSAVVAPPSGGAGARIVLPDRAFLETDAGVGMLLVPVVIVEGGGLRYDAGGGTFRGSIRIGVEDSLQRAGSVNLPDTISFLVTGSADAITPQDLSIGHTNLPFAAVSLEEATPGTNLLLNVRTTLHPDGVDIEIPIDRDELILEASPTRVQGMGLEQATLTLGPAPSGTGAAVQLAADHGNLVDSEVRLSADGTGRTSIRSYWVGTSTVTARSVAFQNAQTTVEFVFPWFFLTIALIGGAVGGTAAWALKKRGAEASGPGPEYLPYLGSGMLLGLIATVAYAVGINVTGYQPLVTTGQAVVFAMAALVGFSGSLVIPQKQAP